MSLWTPVLAMLMFPRLLLASRGEASVAAVSMNCSRSWAESLGIATQYKLAGRDPSYHAVTNIAGDAVFFRLVSTAAQVELRCGSPGFLKEALLDAALMQCAGKSYLMAVEGDDPGVAPRELPVECPDTARPQLLEVVSSPGSVTFRFDEHVTPDGTRVTIRTSTGSGDLAGGGYSPSVDFNGPDATVHLHSLGVACGTVLLDQVMDMHGNVALPLKHDVPCSRWGQDCVAMSMQLCNGDWQLAMSLESHWHSDDVNMLACNERGEATVFQLDLDAGVARVEASCAAEAFLEAALLEAALGSCKGAPYMLRVEGHSTWANSPNLLVECPDTMPPQLLEVVLSPRSLTFRFDEHVMPNGIHAGTASTLTGGVDLVAGGYTPGVEFEGPDVTVHLHSLGVACGTVLLDQVMDMHGNVALPLKHDVPCTRWGQDCVAMSTQLCNGDWQLAMSLKSHWRGDDVNVLACNALGEATVFQLDLDAGIARVEASCSGPAFLEEALLKAGRNII